MNSRIEDNWQDSFERGESHFLSKIKNDRVNESDEKERTWEIDDTETDILLLLLLIDDRLLSDQFAEGSSRNSSVTKEIFEILSRWGECWDRWESWFFFLLNMSIFMHKTGEIDSDEDKSKQELRARSSQMRDEK